LAKRIKCKLVNLRAVMKYSQREVSRKSKVTNVMIHNYEHGMSPRLDTARRIAKALGVRVSDIWPE